MITLEPSQLVGQVLESRYVVEHHLGSGAMGDVFRARHVRLPRLFAIKVLHPRLLSDAKLLKRFVREAQLAGRLSHRNVVGVVDFGEVDGVAYLVMELAMGSPLSLLMPEAPLEPARAISILRQLCDGLDHAHNHGLVHRDLKPDNVIIERNGDDEVVRIIDFGIAVLRESSGDTTERLTTGGLVLGTPHYMAPEVATGRPFDHRADLFALGVISYELLCGRMPFDGDGVDVVHANVSQDAPVMSSRAPGVRVDPRLEVFTRALMARDPTDRPPNAALARSLLDDIASRVEPTTHVPADGHWQRTIAASAFALGSAETIAISTLEQPTLGDRDD